MGEVDSIGALHVGDSVDSNDYTLSTTPIWKLMISFSFLYPNCGYILTSIFPSLAHLNIGIYSSLFSMQVRLPPFLSIQSIDNIDIEHRRDRTLTNGPIGPRIWDTSPSLMMIPLVRGEWVFCDEDYEHC
jgi:hypothetical protein